jgi:hypothetical protein
MEYNQILALVEKVARSIAVPPSSSASATPKRFKRVLLLLACLLLGYLVWVGKPPTFAWVEGKVKLQHLVLNMTWKAAVLDLVLIAALLSTLRWWATDDGEMKTEAATPWTRGATLLLLLGLGLSLLPRLPRLGQSLYNDEAHNFARFFCGSWKTQADGKPALKQTKLFERAWSNPSGNNSQPYSLLAAASYDAWTQATGVPVGQVIEQAVRLPALVAGTVALGLLGLLGWRWGGERLMLAVLLAGGVHGWLVRYSTEARGYSMMLVGIGLLALGMDSALRTGRWRAWLGFSAGVFLCAWSFIGSVYFLLAVFAVLLPYQWCRWLKKEVAAVQVLRLLVAGVLAVLVGAPLLLPMLPQLSRVLQTFTSIQGEMGLSWWQQVLGYLAWGCPWLDSEPQNPLMLSVQRLCAESGIAVAALVLTLLLTLYGGWLLWRRGGSALLLVLASVLSVMLAWALMSLRGQYLHLWYVLYALPAVLLAWAQVIARHPWAAVMLLMPGWISWQYQQLGKQNERGPVVQALGAAWPTVAALRDVQMATFWTNNPIYHPYVQVLNESADLEPLVQKARAEKQALYVSFGQRGSALGTHAEAVKRLEAQQEFELVKTFWGQEEQQFTQYLYKLKQ